MTFVYEHIPSFENFAEFDDVFDASESRLDLNFFSIIPGIITSEDKKNYYRLQIESAIAGTWPMMNEGETLFLYKGVVDGVVVEFAGGFIETDGVTFRGHWYMTSPDSTGSRNPIYTAEAAESRRSLYTEHGLTGYKVLTYVGSSLYQWFKIRINGGAMTLISETEKEMGDNTHVTFHLGV
tara:strand:+ start:5239 stop:5781 length:543 start_codon:yes stop_codon:yes gene_type:complete